MTHLKRVSCLNDVDHTAIVIWLLKEKKKEKNSSNENIYCILKDD